jgi:hypothetical protein
MNGVLGGVWKKEAVYISVCCLCNFMENLRKTKEKSQSEQLLGHDSSPGYPREAQGLTTIFNFCILLC